MIKQLIIDHQKQVKIKRIQKYKVKSKKIKFKRMKS